MGQELTKSDVEKIQAEIDHRKLVLRPQITREIAEAAAQGDRSENFEYYAAKKANRENNGRIHYLERVLRFAKIISDESKEDEVGLNNTVTLYFEDDDEENDYGRYRYERKPEGIDHRPEHKEECNGKDQYPLSVFDMISCVKEAKEYSHRVKYDDRSSGEQMTPPLGKPFVIS